MINGRSYTSNVSKLLKHLDVLENLRHGSVSPIMLHLAITNACNLKCKFCCFKNRASNLCLSLDQIKTALYSFHKLGTKAVEITGGGEPLLHKSINEVITYATHDLQLKLGICTNGSMLRKVTEWNKVQWVRLGLYGIEQDYTPDLDYIRQFKVKISAAYVWDGQSLENLIKTVEFAEHNQLPTRIAVDAICETSEIERRMVLMSEALKNINTQYAFISDFNLKTTRRNDNCYMHMVKPFIFPDGFVYSCPSAELSHENGFDVNEQFRLCSINEIEEYFSNLSNLPRTHSCLFCKYSQQNELIEDVLMETEFNEFV